ncbi:MAG: phosphocholine cytidylyltransferase family protein [Deltaproteobacteria bacterium]|nr:phosphocholine cytidylyltransferase family protein [Deltaproteobacteria bacterium]
MKAVLLVAGMSSRLRPLTDDTPKCLLSVAGVPILRRCVTALRSAGVTEIVAVTGYLEDTIKAVLGDWFGGPVTYRRNDIFNQTQNGASLLCARDVVEGQPFVMLDGDIVFDPEVLRLVVASEHADCLALRPADDLGEEEVKVYVDPADRTRVTRIHVSLPPADAVGESIGIEKFSAATSAVLFKTIEARIAEHGAKTEYYEKAFDQLCQEGTLTLRAIDVGTLYCAEIDTPDDLAVVQRALEAGAIPPGTR